MWTIVRLGAPVGVVLSELKGTTGQELTEGPRALPRAQGKVGAWRNR